jgi:L-serine dehydratase
MRAAHRFAQSLHEGECWARVQRLEICLYGSLALTGVGHGTDKAIVLGLLGNLPESVDPDSVDGQFAAVCSAGQIDLLGCRRVAFCYEEDLKFLRRVTLPEHPNGLQLTALDADGQVLAQQIFFSIGGGFILTREEVMAGGVGRRDEDLRFPFQSGADLLRLSREHGMSFSQIVMENEKAWATEDEIRARLLHIWDVMQQCVKTGCQREGILPGAEPPPCIAR